MVGTSTSEDEGLAVEAVKLGAVDYFRKPFEVDEVLTECHGLACWAMEPDTS